MPDNPVDLSGIWSAPAPPTPSTTSSTPDVASIWGGSSAPQTPPPPPSDEIGQIWGEPRPVNGQSISPSSQNGGQGTTYHPYQDPNKGLLERAWDFANTPITESLFGLPTERAGAGGFERGAEHLLSGFTSPLSLLLTAATFGTAGVIESAGANLLKEAGLSATEIADVAKGSEAALKATRDLAPGETAVTDAVRQAGVDPDLWNRGSQILHDNGLTEQDLLGGNALERGAYHLIKKAVPDTPAAVAVRMSKTGQALLNAGFTLQQFQMAAQMSPRFLDALKDGDYDKAAEYGTEALAGGVLGSLGAGHALHSAGELFSPVLEPGARLRPTDATLAVQRLAGERDKQNEIAVAQARGLDKQFRDTLGHQDPQKNAPFPLKPEVQAKQDLENASVLHQIVTGGGKDRAADWASQLRVADGKIPYQEHTVGNTTYRSYQPEGSGTEIQVVALNPNGERVGEVVVAPSEDEGRDAFTTSVEVPEKFRKQGVAKALYEQLPVIAKQYGVKRIFGEAAQLEGGKGIWNSLAADGTAVPIDMSMYGEQPRLGMLTENALDIHHLGNGQNSGFAKLPEKYKNLILTSLDRVANGELSDRELAAANQIKFELDKNYEIADQSDLFHNYVEDYMQRLYKDNNPGGKIILDQARQGKFATNVSMAKQRVYDSHLTALLKSPKELVLDPVALTAEGRRVTLQAAAMKQFLQNIRSQGVLDSTGRPVIVLPGNGRVVEGSDGENPATMIDPNRLSKIPIADPQVQHLTQSGDLQRFLDDGTIKDITPKVNPSNIAVAIDKLENKLGKPTTKDQIPLTPEGDAVRLQQLQLLRDVQAGRRPVADLKEYNDTIKPLYAWDPQGYIALDHPAFRGWKFVTQDTAGNNVLVNSDMMASPEYAEFLKNRLGIEKSSLQQNPVSKALLGAGGAIKKNILSLSPFHLAQEALRAVMIGINPLHIDGPDIETGAKVDPNDPNSETKIAAGVRNGFTPGIDYKGLEDHSEGVSGGTGLLRKVPLVGKTVANSLDWYQNFLFKRYIPGLKSRGYELMFDRYQQAHPDWTVDHVAKAAAIHANDTFGGQNWRALGRSATTQDWGRLLALAPDWLEAEARAAARLFNKDEGDLGRAQMLKMTMALWGVARVLNMVSSGKPHLEAPFGVAVQSKDGKEIIYSVRTLPTDILHAASDPANFVKGRLSPAAHLGIEAATGRDNFGRKLSPGDMAVDVLRNMLPIPAQALGQVLSGTGPEVGNIGQGVKAAGGTAQVYQTPAQKLAAELASNHSESGPIDVSQMARHRTIMNFEDQLRSGQITIPDIDRMTAAGDLHLDDRKKIMENLKATHEMDPGTASLYVRASRLPAKEYLDLYDVMSPHEKAALLPLTLKVRKRYINQAMKNERPQDRIQDPVFQRMFNLVPEQSPF